MWFLGILEQPCPNNIYEIDHDFLFPIDPAKSGKKLAGQNELKVYLSKVQTRRAQEIKPPTGPNGQEYPSHFVKAEYKGGWWDRIFKDAKLKVNVDWATWQDRDHYEDRANDFSIDNMVKLMKDNGDWDEDDE